MPGPSHHAARRDSGISGVALRSQLRGQPQVWPTWPHCVPFSSGGQGCPTEPKPAPSSAFAGFVKRSCRAHRCRGSRVRAQAAAPRVLRRATGPPPLRGRGLSCRPGQWYRRTKGRHATRQPHLLGAYPAQAAGPAALHRRGSRPRRGPVRGLCRGGQPERMPRLARTIRPWGKGSDVFFFNLTELHCRKARVDTGDVCAICITPRA